MPDERVRFPLFTPAFIVLMLYHSVLQTDEVRMKAWPKLLCLDRHGLQDLDFRHHLETPHPMTDQIQRDIDRSLTHFLHVRK